MDKISVIIPVYNVEKYLSECLDSVIRQTYANLEIILVDDGSTDTSGVLCDEYAKKDERIKVIHKPNGGLSSARNSGLNVFSGEYFSFVDSDDVIDKKYIQTLYDNVKRENCNLSVCSYLRFNDDVIEQEEIKKEYSLFTGKECFQKILDGQIDLTVAWGKLYKRDFFGAFRFNEGQNNEDELYANNFIFVKKIVYTPSRLYFYRNNERSIINSGFSLSKLSAVEALESREKFLLEHGFEEYVHQNRKNLLYKIIFLYFECKKAGFKEQKKALKVKFKSYFDKKNTSFTKKDLFRLKLFKFCPFLYKTVTDAIRRIKCRKK